MASAGALFGNLARGNQNKNLVEFKAGKSIMKGKMVHPDKRKGLLYIYQSDDQLMHLCWKDRSKGTIEDDLIIFPDDIEYKAVPQCTTGRVYLLKLKSNNKKMFYWMQEPKADKDAELWSKLNEFLNNPPTPSSSRSGGSSLLPSDLASGLSDSADIQSLLGSMDPQQMLRLITGMGNMSSLLGSRSSSSMSSDSNPPSRLASATVVTTSERTAVTTAAPTAVTASSASTAAPTAVSSLPVTSVTAATNGAPKPGTPAIQLSDLQNILSTFQATGSQPDHGIQDIDVLKSISPDTLLPLLVDPQIQERLVPFLPEGEVIPKTVEELKDTVHSPQFQQTLRGFCGALLTGQLGPLIAQFNLGDDAVAAAEKGDVCAFAEALQKRFKKEDEDK